MARRVAPSPKGITSTGSGRRRVGRRTSVVGNDDHATRRRRQRSSPEQGAAAALDQVSEARRSRRRRRPSEIEPRDVIERGQRDADGSPWAWVTSEVGTQRTREAPATLSPSRSTKCREVEPEPRPSRMPSRTCASARAGACRFSPSISTCKTMPQEIATTRREIADHCASPIGRLAVSGALV